MKSLNKKAIKIIFFWSFFISVNLFSSGIDFDINDPKSCPSTGDSPFAWDSQRNLCVVNQKVTGATNKYKDCESLTGTQFKQCMLENAEKYYNRTNASSDIKGIENLRKSKRATGLKALESFATYQSIAAIASKSKTQCPSGKMLGAISVLSVAEHLSYKKESQNDINSLLQEYKAHDAKGWEAQVKAFDYLIKEQKKFQMLQASTQNSMKNCLLVIYLVQL